MIGLFSAATNASVTLLGQPSKKIWILAASIVTTSTANNREIPAYRFNSLPKLHLQQPRKTEPEQ